MAINRAGKLFRLVVTILTGALIFSGRAAAVGVCVQCVRCLGRYRGCFVLWWPAGTGCAWPGPPSQCWSSLPPWQSRVRASRGGGETTFDPCFSSLLSGPVWVLVRPGTKVYVREMETWPSHYRSRSHIHKQCLCRVCCSAGKKDKSAMDDY